MTKYYGAQNVGKVIEIRLFDRASGVSLKGGPVIATFPRTAKGYEAAQVETGRLNAELWATR